ncbi:MAG: GNAT family N-acetyltransferase [Mycobacteriaceae bacterium]
MVTVNDDSSISVCTLPVRDFLSRVDELVDLHLDAMAYPRSAFTQRRLLWAANSRKQGFVCVIALEHPRDTPADPSNPGHRGVGVAYGFPGSRSTWWYGEVNRGLRGRGLTAPEVAEILSDYDEISEVHVHPDFQGHGIGHRMLDLLLPQLHSRRAMLSTPEVADEGNAAWALYRSLGFRDVLRDFRFGSDTRPFGILSLDRTAG